MNWDYLSFYDIYDLLDNRPQLEEEVHNRWTKWNTLSGPQWVYLLLNYPRFIDKCVWSNLEWKQVKQLLVKSNNSTLAQECRKWQKWDQLRGDEWVWLLSHFPKFIDKCKWEKLDWPQLRQILEGNPTFAEQCQSWTKWDLLEKDDWVWLLELAPKLADKCKWEKLDWPQVKQLLEGNPTFAEQCRSWTKWSKLRKGDWVWLLKFAPELADKCNNHCWNMLKWEELENLLHKDSPTVLVDKCLEWQHWNTLEGSDWATLLCECPRFAAKCYWEKLSGHDWVKVLINRPEFAAKCHWWEKLSGHDWVKVLINRPEFAAKCHWWEKLSGQDWVKVLINHPEFAAKCHWWEKLSGYDWVELLINHPEFAAKCEPYWGHLSEEDWKSLLCIRPQFADKCHCENLEKYKQQVQELCRLICEQRQIKNLKRLDLLDFAELLRSHPGLYASHKNVFQSIQILPNGCTHDDWLEFNKAFTAARVFCEGEQGPSMP